MKKFVSILLALVMALSLMSVTAFADSDGSSIAVQSDDNHTYEVYQIFTGDLSEGVLSNVKWGANGTGTTGEAVSDEVLSALEAVKDSTSDVAKLEVIKTYVKLDSTPITVTKDAAYDAAPGYYLIKDVDADITATEAQTLYVVQLVDDVTISRKADSVPSTEKVIVDGDKDTKVNEAGIGDTVNFKITATVPADAENYDYYYFIIKDTLEEGLTLDTTSFAVSGSTTTAPGYTLKTGEDADAYTFQLALKDAKALAGETITVTYSAVVNDKATVGTDPNTNKEVVDFSNNPNFKYDGTQEPDPENPENPTGFPDSTKTVPTGETIEEKTDTYVTALNILKVDENGEVLTGAGFTLTGDTNKVRVSTATSFVEDKDGTYYKLANGKYTTEAPVTEETMAAAPEGATEGWVVAEENYDGTDAKVVGGTKYRPVQDGETPAYILVEVNADLYEAPVEGVYAKYKKVITTTTMGTGCDSTTIVGAVDADGFVTFEGLGEGTYTITETTTPAGYNTIAPITFTVSFDPETKTFSANVTKGTATITGGSVLSTTIVNQSGTELPETGGIGTTIFYVMGGLLVVAAGVLLITKKRMASRG